MELTAREKASGIWLPGFKPGLHCTEVCHRVAGVLKELPAKRDSRAPYVCEECLPNVLRGFARSEAAKRAVATRCAKGGKRAPR